MNVFITVSKLTSISLRTLKLILFITLSEIMALSLSMRVRLIIVAAYALSDPLRISKPVYSGI